MKHLSSAPMSDPSNDASASPNLDRGAAIGRYVVLGLVGRGAMGEVYAAYDPELDRKVAVKLLRTQNAAHDLAAAEARSRLLREAQAIARLSHPNVIVVHDVGSFGEQVFVAMEFVDGHTVGYWLLAGRRSWRDVLAVFMAAGRGLAAAHASGLVHRDFKLENVMIGHDGQVRVMDFGLARMVAGSTIGDSGHVAAPEPSQGGDDGAADVMASVDDSVSATRIIAPSIGSGAAGRPTVLEVRTTSEVSAKPPSLARGSGRVGDTPPGSLSADLTHTGAILGTPAYMAPEQFSGNPADERSDQFSFCVALFEALHGQRPFAGSTVAELADNVRRGRISLPADATRVPGWLRRVVLRGLRTDPAERWSSMDTLLDALQKDPGVVRRRWAMVVAATAGIAGIGVAAGRHGARESRPTCRVPGDRFTHVWEAEASPGSRREAIAKAFGESGHPYAADVLAGTSQLLDGYVSAWSSMFTDSCEATNVRGEQSPEVLDLRMSCLRDRWNEMRALSDVLVDPKDEVVANAAKAAAALTPVDRCADLNALRAAVPPPTDPATRKKVESLRMRLATAKALLDTGRFTRALSAAIPLVSEARTLRHAPTLSEALYRLAEVQLSLVRPTEAGSNFDEAIWTAVSARDDEIAATAAIDQIFVAGYLKRDTSSARRWFREAEALLARMGGHEILNAWMQHNFGAALETEGDLEGAADRYERAMAIKEKLLGGDHPDVALSLTNLASVLLVLGRPEDALVHSNRGVRIMEKVLGMEHPETATQWGNRAEILNQLGRYAEARRDAERGLAVWRRELGSENADQLFFLAPLGEARMGLGESREAVALLERALGIAERHDVRSETRRLRFALARALWQEGRDRVRAIEVGRLAASSMPVDDKTISGGAWATRDHGIQREAAEWVAARQAAKRGSRVSGRFRSGPF